METADYRTFIAVNLPVSLLATIGQLQQSLRYKPGARIVRWTKPAQIHLTLEFLGNVSVERIPELSAAVQNACAASAPFSLTISGLGCFPSVKKPHVIWLGIAGDVEKLKALQAALHDAVLSFREKVEDREFQAHLTIGRVKQFGPRAAKQVEELMRHSAVNVLGAWQVESVTVMRSELLPEGPRHSELAAVKLIPQFQKT